MLYFSTDKNKSVFSLKPFQTSHLLCQSYSDLYQYFFWGDIAAYESGLLFLALSSSIIFVVIFFLKEHLEELSFKNKFLTKCK